jgi:hypothetical protein
MEGFAVGPGQEHCIPEICKDLEEEERFMTKFSQRMTMPVLFKDDFQKFFLPLTSFNKVED